MSRRTSSKSRPSQSPTPSQSLPNAPSPAPTPPMRIEEVERQPELEVDRGPAPATARMFVIGLLLLAFALRLGYLLEFQHSPLFKGLVLDEEHYDKWAQAIAGGDWFGHGPFTSNPLSPYMLGLIYSIFGRDLFFTRLIQMAADTASCYFIYRIALRLFDRRVALLALGMAAVYGPMIFYAANYVAEVWVIFFASLSLALLVHSDRWTLGGNASQPTSRAERRRAERGVVDQNGPISLKASGPRLRFLAGICFAIAALGRPNMMLMAPLLPFAMSLADDKLSREQRVKRAVFWMAGIGLVLGSTFMRNVIRGDDPVLITAHGGVNLWIGNNPDADGFFKTPRNSGLEGGQETLINSSIRVAEREVGHKLKASESSSWWNRRALSWALTNPGSFMALTLKKTGYFFNEYEKPLESNYHYGKLESVVLHWLTIGFGLVCPLALTGMALAWSRRKQTAVLYLFAAVYAGGVIAFFVSMRYRMPIVIVFLPFAGFALVALWDRVRAAAPAAWVPAVATLAGMVVLTELPLAAGEVPHDLAHTYYTLGNLEHDKGNELAAIVQYEKAVALYPEWGLFYNNLGLAYLKSNQAEKAVGALQKAIELDSAGLKVYRNLAKAYRAQGKLEEAANAYRKALDSGPKHVPTLMDLGETLEAEGKLDEARQEYALALMYKGSTPQRRAKIQAHLTELGGPVAGAASSARPASSSPAMEESEGDRGD